MITTRRPEIMEKFTAAAELSFGSDVTYHSCKAPDFNSAKESDLSIILYDDTLIHDVSDDIFNSANWQNNQTLDENRKGRG